MCEVRQVSDAEVVEVVDARAAASGHRREDARDEVERGGLVLEDLEDLVRGRLRGRARGRLGARLRVRRYGPDEG